MTADIKIGSDTVKLCGNAATAIRYKQLFHRDLLMQFKGMDIDNFEADIVKELAFVMTQQAQGADFRQVSFDDYVDWLAQYEEQELLQAAASIINVWIQNTATAVQPKKK